MWGAIINILLGLWLMFSPDLLQFEKAASNNNHIIGPLVLTVAITALWEVNRSVRFFNIPLGAWLVVSPFILGFQLSTAAALWGAILPGVLIIVFSLVKGSIKRRYGGGWRSLFTKDPEHARQQRNIIR
jgi:hypothetical protein